MSDPKDQQQTGDTRTSPDLVTTIAAVQGFGRDLPVSYHLAKGAGDSDWQEIWCGGGVLFPNRAKVAPDAVCVDCVTAKQAPRPSCTCGSPDAFSLNPAEVLVHRVDEPCYIAEAKR